MKVDELKYSQVVKSSKPGQGVGDSRPGRAGPGSPGSSRKYSLDGAFDGFSGCPEKISRTVGSGPLEYAIIF
jgi:hypothetical protein